MKYTGNKSEKTERHYLSNGWNISCWVILRPVVCHVLLTYQSNVDTEAEELPHVGHRQVCEPPSSQTRLRVSQDPLSLAGQERLGVRPSVPKNGRHGRHGKQEEEVLQWRRIAWRQKTLSRVSLLGKISGTSLIP